MLPVRQFLSVPKVWSWLLTVQLECVIVMKILAISYTRLMKIHFLMRGEDVPSRAAKGVFWRQAIKLQRARQYDLGCPEKVLDCCWASILQETIKLVKSSPASIMEMFWKERRLHTSGRPFNISGNWNNTSDGPKKIEEHEFLFHTKIVQVKFSNKSCHKKITYKKSFRRFFKDAKRSITIFLSFISISLPSMQSARGSNLKKMCDQYDKINIKNWFPPDLVKYGKNSFQYVIIKWYFEWRHFNNSETPFHYRMTSFRKDEQMTVLTQFFKQDRRNLKK